MRLLETGTKYFDINSYNVPKLDNTWGCMIDFFDTILVNGSESQDILSITVEEDLKYPEQYWIATLVLNKGHGFRENCSVITIAESSIPAFNNTFRVQEVTETSINIAFNKTDYITKPSNIEYTFGMTLSMPSLGYEKIFTAPQKAVYKVTTKDDKYCYLRVDNSCPEGHDPSWAKFSRVSMFSDIKDIDDFHQKLSRVKAPIYSEDHNRVEEYIYDIWLYTRYKYDDYVDIKSASTLPIKEFCLVGDSQTFYLYINALTEYNSDNGDCTYMFGSYIKTMFKEDPTPFLLRTSERQNYTSNYFQYIQDKDNFIGNRIKGKHLFSNVTADTFHSGISDRWSQWYAEYFISGQSTGVNYVYYRNEMIINLLPMLVLTHRNSGILAEGILRGTYFIMANLIDSSKIDPNILEVIKQESKVYLKIPAREDAWDYACYAVSLSDWE